MNGRRCRALLAPHPAILVEHFIDPMDYHVRQIVVVPSVVAVDHNLHRVDRSGIVYNGGCSCPRYRKLSRANLGQVQPGKGWIAFETNLDFCFFNRLVYYRSELFILHSC